MRRSEMSGEKGNGAQGRDARSDALVIESIAFFDLPDNNVRQCGMAVIAVAGRSRRRHRQQCCASRRCKQRRLERVAKCVPWILLTCIALPMATSRQRKTMGSIALEERAANWLTLPNLG
jgi:hypothetical protein